MPKYEVVKILTFDNAEVISKEDEVIIKGMILKSKVSRHVKGSMF